MIGLPSGFSEPFVLKAIAAGVGLAIVSAPLGCIAVWRRMAYVGETLAQACLLGVAVGLTFDLNLTFAVVLAAVAAAALIAAFGRQKLLALDSILGLLHHGLLALGVVAIVVLKGPAIDLMSYLFGDLFAVSSGDLVWIYGGGAGVIAAICLLWQPLVRLSLNEDLAAAEGVDPTRTRAAFDLLLALFIAVAMKIVGILLIMAFLVVPAVAARPWAAGPERMAVIAAALAATGVFGGVWLSLSSDTPGGPSIVLAMCLIAAISLLAHGRRSG